MLKRVSIQNFKSLKDVTLDLQKVNLLIGPNNSGKTNFLKAFDLLAQIANEKKDITTDDYYKKQPSELIHIHLIYFDEAVENGLYEHVFLDWIDDEEKGEFYSVFSDLSNQFDINIDNLVYRRPLDKFDFDYNNGYYRVYKPDPNKLSKSAPVGEGARNINADTSNLVAFLDYILSEHRSVFNRIEQDLRKCVPEFSEINLQNVKSTKELIKQFGDKTFKRLGLTDGRQNVKYWADELSEGTLYFLALLCIINQPNPPKLLLLEEPEKGIHPRRIREIMDFIFRLAEEKDVQVIMTTHNENVLNEFTDTPEAVFVFEKDAEGATHVKNLLHDIIEPSHKHSQETGTKAIDFTRNLGENWMYGLLGGVPEEAL